MIFEIALRQPLLSPASIPQGNEKPRPADKAHLLGRDKIQDISGGMNQGGRNDEPNQGKFDARGARRLETITPGEIKRAVDLYKNQLVSISNATNIAINHFTMLDLEQRDNMPAVIFGRATVCLPSDGHIQNIREMELAFPQPGKKPESVILHPRDFPPHGNIQSYSFGIKSYLADDEYDELVRFEHLFLDAGFTIQPSNDLEELIHAHELVEVPLPWFHLIGSRWFADIPDSLKDTIRSGLWKLSARETLILNYHPAHVLHTVKKLNDELEYQYRLTRFYLPNPQSPQQVLHIIRTIFDKVFHDPASKPSLLSNRQERIE